MSVFQKRLLFIATLLLLTFTFFSWGIKRGAMKSADFAFTVKLQDAIDTSPMLRTKEFVGEIMEGSTFFASPEVSIAWVLVLTGFTVIDVKKKKIRWKGFVIPLLFLFLTLAEITGKTVVHHPAPPFFMIKNPTSLFPKYYINEQFSYPSGHAARAVFLAVCTFSLITSHVSRITLRAMMKKRLILGSGLIFISYCALVFISRIYLGHHWLSDIIGGVFLGGSFGLFSIIVL